MERQHAPRTNQACPINQESYNNFPDSAVAYPNQYEYPVMPSTHQMVHLNQEDYDIHDHHSDTIASFADQYAWAHMHLSMNDSDPSIRQFRYDDRTHAQDQDRFTRNQFLDPSSNFEVSGSTVYDDFVTQMEPCNVATGIVLDEYAENRPFANSRMVDRKRKNPEVTKENYIATELENYIVTKPAYSNLYPEDVYLNSRLIPRTGPYGCTHRIHSRNFASQDFTGTLPATNGFNAGIIRTCPQVHHRNCMVQHHYGDCHQHPRYHNWNYAGGLSHINGGQLHPGAMGSLNMHRQEHPNASINRNTAFMPPYLQHVPGMLDHAYNQYTHVPESSYWRSFENLRPPNGYPRTRADSASRFQRTHVSIAETILSTFPRVSHVEDPDIENHYSEYPLSEDRYVQALLDVDNMTYEELLDLGEQIGHVSTGLSEDSISMNLNIRMWDPMLDLSPSCISTQSAGEKCVICLDDYKARDKIGKMECGHSFHADCIKKWLLIKNMCPICKKPVLSTSRRNN